MAALFRLLRSSVIRCPRAWGSVFLPALEGSGAVDWVSQQVSDESVARWLSQTSPYSDQAYTYRQKPPSPPFVDFRVMNDPYHVLDELASLKDYLLMRHVSAALSRLKNLDPRPPEEVLEEVTSLGQSTLGSASGNDVVGTFVACAKLRFVNLELLNGLANRAIKMAYVPEFSIRELASMVHSVVVLMKCAERRSESREGRSQGFDPKAMYGMQRTDELLTAMLDELALFRRSDREMDDRLPSVISSLALIDRRDSRLDTLMAEVLKVSDRLSTMDLEGLTNAVLTVNKTNQAGDRQALLSELCNEISRPENLANFQWERMVKVMEVLSGLGYAERGVWKGFFEEAITPRRLAEYRLEDFNKILRVAHRHGVGDAVLGSTIGKEIMKQEIHSRLSDTQLASVIAALGKYNMGKDNQVIKLLPRAVRDETVVKWSSELLGDLAHACLTFNMRRLPLFDTIAKEMARPARIESFDAVSTVKMLDAFLKRKWYHRDLFPTLMKECLRDTHVAGLEKSSLLQLVVLLGRTNKVNILITLEPFLKRLTDPAMLEDYDEEELASVVYNLGRFRDISPESLRPLLNEAGKPERVSAFEPPHVSAMVLGLSRLGLYDEQIVERLCRHAVLEKDVAELDGLDVVALMTGLADLGHVSYDVVNALMVHLVKGIKYTKFYLEGLEHILDALVRLDMTDADHCEDITWELGRKKERLKHAKANTVCNVLYVMGKQGMMQNKLIHQVFRKIANAKRNGKFDDTDMIAIREAVYRSGIQRTNLLDVVRVKGVPDRTEKDMGSFSDSDDDSDGDDAPETESEQKSVQSKNTKEKKPEDLDYGTKLLSLIL